MAHKKKRLTARAMGKMGGKARAASLTPHERSRIARTAAAARWGPLQPLSAAKLERIAGPERFKAVREPLQGAMVTQRIGPASRRRICKIESSPYLTPEECMDFAERIAAALNAPRPLRNGEDMKVVLCTLSPLAGEPTYTLQIGTDYEFRGVPMHVVDELKKQPTSDDFRAGWLIGLMTRRVLEPVAGAGLV